MVTILHLDDDYRILADVNQFLSSEGFEILSCAEVESAHRALELKPNFAIIDLFLSGDEGAHLSNQFIEEFISPIKLGYGRMSSAPSLVPKEFAGSWVLDKRLYLRDRRLLLENLMRHLEH